MGRNIRTTLYGKWRITAGPGIALLLITGFGLVLLTGLPPELSYLRDICLGGHAFALGVLFAAHLPIWEPANSPAPTWATALGQTPEGAWHWLEKPGPLETPDSERYFPLSGRTKFTGYVGWARNDNDGLLDYLGRQLNLKVSEGRPPYAP